MMMIFDDTKSVIIEAGFQPLIIIIIIFSDITTNTIHGVIRGQLLPYSNCSDYCRQQKFL